MTDWVYRNRHRIQLAGLVMVVAGLGVAIGLEVAAGLAIVGAAALLFVTVQPQLLAHLRSRQGRRRAPRNGHLPGADADDVRPPSRSES
jgi:predicted Kef-type K+ transport protein